MQIAAGRPVLEVIKLSYQANKPALLVGSHGIGKSSFFDDAARELGIGVIVRDLSLMEPPDLIGMPQIANGVTTYAAPSFLPRDGKGILVFEELNRCPRYMRASCLELLTARQLNDYILPKGWVPMAAINPVSDGYIDTEELDAALLSRFVCIEVTAVVEEWCLWARAHDVHEQVIQLVEKSPGVFDSNGPCPRSWTYASDILFAWELGNDRNDETLAAALAGTLGDEWAVAFLQYSKHGVQPLTAKLIVIRYPAQRAMLKRWVADARLDLVIASLESLKRHLQPQRTYDAVIKQARQKTNVEMFFSDLPASLKRQARDWLEERGFTELTVPGKTRK